MKRTIDMIRHQRDSSMSTLGSGDWGSDIGSMFEELSTGELSTSASVHSSRTRAVAEMAILAATSPEIKALSLKRGNSFPQAYRASIMLPSPCSSVASSTLSRTNLSVASLFGDADTSMEETKHHDDLDFTPTKSTRKTIEPIAALSFENLRIEPPPSPKREQIADIASIIEEENIPPNIRVYSTPTSETNSQGSNQKARKFCFAGRSYLRDSFGSCGSSSKRPPKPLKSSTPKSPSRRPSMHRRVSFNSLPSPSEIDSFVPSLLSSSSSERTLSYTSSSERSLFSSASEGGRKTGHRKGSSKRVVPRSLNLSKFYC